MEGQTGTSDPYNFQPTEEQPILLTASAVEAVRKAIQEEGEEGDALRVSVTGGGCSGFQYSLGFEKDAREDDTVLEFEGVRVLVDSISSGYLTGAVIDFVSGLNGTGFKFHNPNAKRTCGCGSSFS
jgi:iron-sulfur cluster assembly accessory protein